MEIARIKTPTKNGQWVHEDTFMGNHVRSVIDGVPLDFKNLVNAAGKSYLFDSSDHTLLYLENTDLAVRILHDSALGNIFAMSSRGGDTVIARHVRYEHQTFEHYENALRELLSVIAKLDSYLFDLMPKPSSAVGALEAAVLQNDMTAIKRKVMSSDRGMIDTGMIKVRGADVRAHLALFHDGHGYNLSATLTSTVDPSKQAIVTMSNQDYVSLLALVNPFIVMIATDMFTDTVTVTARNTFRVEPHMIDQITIDNKVIRV